MTDTPRRRPNNELRLLVGVIAALAILTTLAVLFLPQPPDNTRASNRGGGGTSLLREWLETAGYRAVILPPGEPPSDFASYDALLVFAPDAPYPDDLTADIAAWVNDGGRLIVAARGTTVNSLLAPYQIEIGDERMIGRQLDLTAPTLTDPAFSEVRMPGPYPVNTLRTDAAAHLALDGVPVLVSVEQGRGRVFVSGTLHPFTNDGLADEASAALVANLLSGLPSGARVAFDESQVEQNGDDTPGSLLVWLLSSNPGRGVMLFGVVMLVWMVSGGRRFGPAVPLTEDRLRREPVEYIIAIAGLFKRGGRRADVLAHHKTRLRRALAARYTLDPTLDDPAFLRQLRQQAPNVNAAAVKDLFQQLSAPRPSEQAMVKAAADVEAFLSNQGG